MTDIFSIIQDFKNNNTVNFEELIQLNFNDISYVLYETNHHSQFYSFVINEFKNKNYEHIELLKQFSDFNKESLWPLIIDGHLELLPIYLNQFLNKYSNVESLISKVNTLHDKHLVDDTKYQDILNVCFKHTKLKKVFAFQNTLKIDIPFLTEKSKFFRDLILKENYLLDEYLYHLRKEEILDLLIVYASNDLGSFKMSDLFLRVKDNALMSLPQYANILNCHFEKLDDHAAQGFLIQHGLTCLNDNNIVRALQFLRTGHLRLSFFSNYKALTEEFAYQVIEAASIHLKLSKSVSSNYRSYTDLIFKHLDILLEKDNKLLLLKSICCFALCVPEKKELILAIINYLKNRNSNIIQKSAATGKTAISKFIGRVFDAETARKAENAMNILGSNSFDPSFINLMYEILSASNHQYFGVNKISLSEIEFN